MSWGSTDISAFWSEGEDKDGRYSIYWGRRPGLYYGGTAEKGWKEQEMLNDQTRDPFVSLDSNKPTYMNEINGLFLT